MKNNIKIIMLAALGFIACDSNNDDDTTVVEVPVTPGSAVFTNYVALGDSFAAGYSDNALFMTGQQGAYTNILSQQFVAAGGGEFTTPLTDNNIGGLLFAGNVIAGTRVYFNGAAPVPVPGPPTTEVTNHLSGSFNNLGVPGAKSYHLLAPGYGNAAGVPSGKANPYFVRFATSPSTSVLADALMQSPTFFSLWIGGNDVLGFATSGGDGVNQTGNPDPATYGSNDITDPAVFANVYNVLSQKLTANGAKGVVANLPYVTTLPYFTTVPFNPLTASVLGQGSVPAGEAAIGALNAQLYGPLKQALTAFGAGDRINLLSTTVANPLLISDEKLPNLAAQLTAAFTPTLGAQTAAVFGAVFGQARQATKADLVLLTTRAVIAGATGYPAPLDKFGVTFPLLDKHVLIASEVNEVKTATDAYNKTIEDAAITYNLAFVDSKKIMTQLSTGGIRFGNYQMTAAYVTGGAFSLDGVHPSARGYALIANLFVTAINTKYESTLQQVDLAKYQIQYQKDLP